jgi:hypothetical protein
VSTAIGQMNSNLSLTASSLSANDPILYRVLLKFSEGIDTIKSSVESATQSDDLSLGVTLNLYEKYTLKAKAMLHERSVYMNRMESTKKAAEKATPKKQEAAEKAKEEAQTKFDEVSSVAKREVC